MMSLGKLLAAAKAPWIAQHEVAAGVGVSPEHIRRIFLGTSYPSGELLEYLLNALEVPPDRRLVAWRLLAEHQLDPEVRAHVTLSPHPDVLLRDIAALAAVEAENVLRLQLDARERKALREALEQKLTAAVSRP
jgi:transcriptional regulator with XRE-family HTH domain